MKHVVIFLICLATLSCEPRYIGPLAGPINNGEDGYWKLGSYIKNGDFHEASDFDSLIFLRVTEINKFDKEYNTNNTHYIFTFYDSNFKDSTVIDAIPWGDEYGPNQKTDIFWYRLSPFSGFRVTLHISGFNEQQHTSRMDLSNIINKKDYQEELDSLQFVYVPTSKFN